MKLVKITPKCSDIIRIELTVEEARAIVKRMEGNVLYQPEVAAHFVNFLADLRALLP